FQSERGLPYQDGRVDPNGGTWNKMVSLAGGLPVLPPMPSIPVVSEKLLRRFNDPPAGFRTPGAWPQVAAPRIMHSGWGIEWGAVASRPIDSWFYECPPNIPNRYIGVSVPRGCRDPDAYLIYYHHPIHLNDKEYATKEGFLNWGIGDYMVGRLQINRQLSV